MLHTQHKDQKESKENGRVQADCIMLSLTSSVFVSITTIFKMVMQSLDNRALRKRIQNVHTYMPTFVTRIGPIALIWYVISKASGFTFARDVSAPLIPSHVKRNYR